MVIAIVSGVLVIVILAIIFFIFRSSDDNDKNQKNIQGLDKHINTTQDQLPFDYIRRDMVKFKNGIFAKIIEVPGVNTQLMEGEGKEDVRVIYASVLNSVIFPIQFYKQSRLVDIKDYVEAMEELETSETDQFKAVGLNTYRNFVSELVKRNSIQTKKDYLVVPYYEEDKKIEKKEEEDRMKKYMKQNNNSVDEGVSIEKQKEFEQAHKILTQRMSTLEKQLRKLNIAPKHLDDEDLFNLFYTTYNKDRSVHQPMTNRDPSDYTSIFVRKDGD